MVIRHGGTIVPAGRFVPGSPSDAAGSHARPRRRPGRLPSPDARRAAPAAPRRRRCSAACMQEGDDPLATAATTTTTGSPTEHRRRRRRASPRTRSSGTTAAAVECATLDVPLDYDDPDGEQIELYVGPHAGQRRPDRRAVRQPRRARRRRRRVRRAPPFVLPEEITEHFDIVGVDPRGVGGQHADRLRHPRRGALRRRPDLRGRRRRGGLPRGQRRRTSTTAREKYGDVLPHVGTPDVARDMDVVRAAMGDEQLSFLGFSYGTVIGQVYADLFPDRVRSMVLDGVVELGPTGLESADEQAAGFETGPRPVRGVLRRRRGMRHRRRHARRGRGGAGPRRGARRHPRRRRRPRRRPGRGEPGHQLRRCTRRASGTTSPTRSPTRSTATAPGSSSWPTATSASAPSRCTSR